MRPANISHPSISSNVSSHINADPLIEFPNHPDLAHGKFVLTFKALERNGYCLSFLRNRRLSGY